MATGSIKRWFGERGYGFIVDDEGQDIFFYIRSSNALKGRESFLVAGVQVDFDKRLSNQKGKEGTFEAYNVRLREMPSAPQVSPVSEELQTQSALSHFYNPYTFVPTPSRRHISSGHFAGDYDPVLHGLTHASLQAELWTGYLPIKVTPVTPLLLPDIGDKERKATEHQTYDMLDALPESSFRGMLRSAYEIVTNSRYACFRNSDRLAYRMDTKEAIRLIPAIIEPGDGSGTLSARLYLGTSTPTEQGPQKRLMYAAMLTLYGDQSACEHDTTTGKTYIPKTGDVVWAEIVLCKHEVSPKDRTHWEEDFLFWKVVTVWPKQASSTPPTQTGRTPWPSARPKTHTQARQSFYAPVDPAHPQTRVVPGKVFITNANMGSKHDERVFFQPMSTTFDVTALKEPWRMRIQSYRDAHTDQEIFERRVDGKRKVEPWDKIGSTPGKTAWSPHLYHDGEHRDRWGRSVHDARHLQPGDMVYARCAFNESGNIQKIVDLFPVMISRELYDDSPKELLDNSLWPATRRDALSPADRLFGWVAQDAEEKTEAAYKSRIRVVCEDGSRSDIVQRFTDGALPLAILGQPKPAQGRFYVAKDKDGTPHDKGGRRHNKGYQQGYTLRGRKQYWHHCELEADQSPEYWQPLGTDWEEQRNGRYQEYRRPNDEKDSQNRSIKGWIKPYTVFHVSLHVQNLQPEEAGALLWLLSLPEKHYFRLGYGKPLGFGSVRLEIDRERLIEGNLPLGTGKDWQRYYGSLSTHGPATLDNDQQQKCIQAFKTSMIAAYVPQPPARSDTRGLRRLSSFAALDPAQFATTPEDQAHLEAKFDNIQFIKEFVQILRGPQGGALIHYPRLQPKPDPKGENFRWFVRNEGRGGHSLPAVTATEGLPYQP
jgi:CRISPR-associated protein (TIGR03986 family)